MLDPRAGHRPTIVYRPIRPSDLEVLEQIHAALFPVRYEREFFFNVVNGHGIISWAAVDISRPDGRNDELIGFVTMRIMPAKESEIEHLLRYNASRNDQILVYILTLGVVERYRNLGIATSLVQEVIKYSSSIPNCRAVYLHVIAYNQPAINFYKKMLFKLVRRLPKFYYIQGQHYDSYLFVYYVNGGQSPCSPLTLPFTWAETQVLRQTEPNIHGTRALSNRDPGGSTFFGIEPLPPCLMWQRVIPSKLKFSGIKLSILTLSSLDSGNPLLQPDLQYADIDESIFF